jgi:transposase
MYFGDQVQPPMQPLTTYSEIGKKLNMSNCTVRLVILRYIARGYKITNYRHLRGRKPLPNKEQLIAFIRSPR